MPDAATEAKTFNHGQAIGDVMSCQLKSADQLNVPRKKIRK